MVSEVTSEPRSRCATCWKEEGPALVERIISGGQTGVDRAALDVAMALGVPCGGWCPRGRTAEDGPIDPRYPLRETPSDDYAQRTEWNVRDSDGTLILTRGRVEGGTAQTVETAKRLGKPAVVLELAQPQTAAALDGWVRTHDIRVLNIAGPRESKQPGVYAQAAQLLREAFAFQPR